MKQKPFLGHPGKYLSCVIPGIHNTQYLIILSQTLDNILIMTAMFVKANIHTTQFIT